MGNNSSLNKSKTLGMPHGTACARLRKQIMFSLLCRLNENVCFKCNLPIIDVLELSIEHKEPWENISAELFWDLDNVAFSHIGCNKPHKYKGGVGKRKVGPENTSWCSGHKTFLEKSLFSTDNSRYSKCQKYCNMCLKERRKMGV